MASKEHDFSVGSIPRNIISLALPMTAAQLINVLYSVVDRIYLGRLPGHLALTGPGADAPHRLHHHGLCQPVRHWGRAPVLHLPGHRATRRRPSGCMGNAFTLLLIFGAAVTAVFLLFKQPLLYLFGASDATYPYADAYMTIYLLGTVFVMIGLGMNPFITSQGFGRAGYDDGGAGGGGQHRAGPGLHLRAGHGGAGRGPGHRDRPGLLRRVGAEIPHRAEGHPAAPACGIWRWAPGG